MERKNILYIFCDELRQDALGCYGTNPAGPMRTPHIDSIAAKGTLFENCFCNSPICVPSRASLITGLYPEDTGVYDNEAAQPAFAMEQVPITFPQVLARAGYDTASFGKTHLPPQLAPFAVDEQAGSEMHLGLTREETATLEKVRPRRGIGFNAASLYPEGKPYYPETVTENAIRWLEDRKSGDAPFLLRVSYTQPHSPIIVKRGYEAIYKDLPFSGALPAVDALSDFEQSFAAAVGLDSLTEAEIIKAKAYYYGMVCWIDDQVGRLLETLSCCGLAGNTVVILNADHGALRGECRGLGKHVFQRASQAVPLIIADPSQPAGRRVREVCSNLDLAATVCGLVGVERPAQFRGRDLFRDPAPGEVYATIGFGEPDSRAFPNRGLGQLSGGRGWPRRSCIRTERYRLDLSTRIDAEYTTAENEDLFFVDCAACPAEDRNMAHDPAYADVVAALREKLLAHCAHPREIDPAMLHIPEAWTKQQRQ